MDRINRVRQIEAIARVLSQENWERIDFVLRQFRCRTESSWSGTREGYVLQMMEQAEDSDIVELAVYLGCNIEVEAESVVPGAELWGDAAFRVFISHLSKYKLIASDIQKELARYGISAFVAHEDIQPTQEWVTQIESALASCDLLVALMHQDFHESNWTDQEIGFVMGRGEPVFSVRLGRDPYGFIGKFQAITLKKVDAFSIALSIFECSLQNKKTWKKAGAALVNSLCNSRSWSSSNSLAPMLSRIKESEPDWPVRLASAFGENDELKYAFEVPSAFNSFFSRFGRDDLHVSKTD